MNPRLGTVAATRRRDDAGVPVLPPRPTPSAAPTRVRSSAYRPEGRCYAASVPLHPDIRLDRVEQLTPAVLAEHGLSGLLVDLDETIVPAGSLRPSRAVRGWLRGLSEIGIPVVILSNGAPKRVRVVSRALRIDGLALIGKPWRPAFRRGLATLNVPADRVAMVGDQLFTDVLGARSFGLRTVLVRPLSTAGLPHTRALRRVEEWFLRGGGHGRPVHR